MCLLVRRQKLCWRERKIIKAHYMLAYKCGLRRLRSGRVAHRLSDYNRHIAYDQCLSMYFYHQNVFFIFNLFSLFLFISKLITAHLNKTPTLFTILPYVVYKKKFFFRNICIVERKSVILQSQLPISVVLMHFSELNIVK